MILHDYTLPLLIHGILACPKAKLQKGYVSEEYLKEGKEKAVTLVML